MSEATVLVERHDSAVTLTLNRPAKRNAINSQMRAEIATALAELDADSAVRVVMLTGAGAAFCAGVDLADPGAPADGSAAPAPRPVAEPLWGFRKPVVAAINGAAVGGGLELALACDIRLAATGARMGLTEVRLGSLPGSGGTQLLPRVVGLGNAARLLFTGELVDAEEALRMGLVTQVVDADQLAAVAGELVARISEAAPLSLIAAKEALRAAYDMPFGQGQALERSLWAELAGTADRAEGRAAFRDKRSPRFVGR